MNLQDQLNAALAGRYEVEREIGQGGMATVYLARDTKHDRQVALKVLHPDLAAALGAERFLAEIRTTANLQHPHILPLHDSGEADGYLFYVMPFVSGETLRARLEREQVLPIDAALRVSQETLSALDYAHRHGVVHRDIKPENILLHDGSALIADFGIVLAVQTAGGQRMTQTGLSLGTPQYMSPEQAMGERHIDGRADIYAMGAVLYEMLTGDPPFTGATVQAIVAKLMTERPTAPRTVRDTVPPHVEAATLRALAKLPADRFATAKEFSDALSGAGAIATTTVPVIERRSKWRSIAIAASVMAVAAIAAMVWALSRESTTNTDRVERYPIAIRVERPPALRQVMLNYGRTLDISPDGSRILYVGRDSTGLTAIFSRDLASLEPLQLPDTRGALALSVSPDGRAVSFVTSSALRVLSLAGATATTVVQGAARNPAWARDDKLYFTQGSGVRTSLKRVAGGGGAVENVYDNAGAQRATGLTNISILPDGSGFLAVSGSATNGNGGDIIAYSFAERRAHHLAFGVWPRVARGYLMYCAPDGGLMAAPFDAKHLSLGGAVVSVTELKAGNAVNQFAISNDGSLVYAIGNVDLNELLWVDRGGATTLVDPSLRGPVVMPALSRDGRRLVYSFDRGIAVRDLDRGTNQTVVRVGNYAAWKPDGHVISYYSVDSGTAVYRLWEKNVDDGTPARLLIGEGGPVESLWTPDSAWLIYRTLGSVAGAGDIWAIRPGVDKSPTKIAVTPAAETQPALSFDGRWLAYVSDESGRSEVYVVPFPNPTGARWTVSSDGGSAPAWAHSGKELFYLDAANKLVSVAVTTSPTFSIGARRVLFPAASYVYYPGRREYDVAPGDQRFLMVRPVAADAPSDVVLVKNWSMELERTMHHK